MDDENNCFCWPSVHIHSAYAWVHFRSSVQFPPTPKYMRLTKFPSLCITHISKCQGSYVWKDLWSLIFKTICLIFNLFCSVSLPRPPPSPEHEFKHMHSINNCIDCLPGTPGSDSRYSVSNYTLRHLCGIQITSAGKQRWFDICIVSPWKMINIMSAAFVNAERGENKFDLVAVYEVCKLWRWAWALLSPQMKTQLPAPSK